MKNLEFINSALSATCSTWAEALNLAEMQGCETLVKTQGEEIVQVGDRLYVNDCGNLAVTHRLNAQEINQFSHAWQNC